MKPPFKQFKTFKPFQSSGRSEAVELSEAIEQPPTSFLPRIAGEDEGED